MALEKVVKFKGFELTYHIVSSVHYDKRSDRVAVDVMSYRDKDLRDENILECIPAGGYNFSAEEFFTSADVIECAYNLIKQKPEWEDATDV